MRVAIVSDTHVPRFVRRLPAAVERVAAERPDAIVHCGDFTSPGAVAPFAAIAPFDGVAGNNDGAEIVARYGRRKVVSYGGARLGLVHGDGARGTTLGRARDAFAGERVDAIAFGHSHIPYLAREGDRWLVNPGSCTDKRRQPRYSFAVLEIGPSGVEARLVFFDG